MRNGPSGSDVGRVSGEIDTLRHELGALVAELDRRRMEALDLGLQARRHPLLTAAVATGAALVLGGALALVIRTRRERRRPVTRMREARRALVRLLDRPDRFAMEPSLASRIAGAVGVALATALTKRIMERAVPPPR